MTATTMLPGGLPIEAFRDVRDDIGPLAYLLAEGLVAHAKTTIKNRRFEEPEPLTSLIHKLGGSHPEIKGNCPVLDDADIAALDLLIVLLTAVIRHCRLSPIKSMPESVDVPMEESAHQRSRVYYVAQKAFIAEGWAVSILSDPQEGGWVWEVRFGF